MSSRLLLFSFQGTNFHSRDCSLSKLNQTTEYVDQLTTESGSLTIPLSLNVYRLACFRLHPTISQHLLTSFVVFSVISSGERPACTSMYRRFRFYISLVRRCSSRTFRYGYLVTTSPQSFAPPSAASSYKVASPTSGVANSRGVTGGVYKARERIHRGMLIHDY